VDCDLDVLLCFGIHTHGYRGDSADKESPNVSNEGEGLKISLLLIYPTARRT